MVNTSSLALGASWTTEPATVCQLRGWSMQMPSWCRAHSRYSSRMIRRKWTITVSCFVNWAFPTILNAKHSCSSLERTRSGGLGQWPSGPLPLGSRGTPGVTAERPSEGAGHQRDQRPATKTATGCKLFSSWLRCWLRSAAEGWLATCVPKSVCCHLCSHKDPAIPGSCSSWGNARRRHKSRYQKDWRRQVARHPLYVIQQEIRWFVAEIGLINCI